MPVLQNSNFNAEVVTSLPGPEWLREMRLASWERFVSSELPRESEEIWRYSRIDELDLDRYAPVRPGAGAEPTWPTCRPGCGPWSRRPAPKPPSS